MAVWTDDEIAAAVDAYLAMLAEQRAGLKLNKSAHRRRALAGPLAGRNDTAFEKRMQNISWVRSQDGQEVLNGYLPLGNAGPRASAAIRAAMKLREGPSTSIVSAAPLPAGVTGATPQSAAGLAPRSDLQPADADESAGTADARVSTLATIRRRRGQKAFRDALIARYAGACAVTGCDVVDVLEAAHVALHAGADDNDPANGLLLRADVHTLFDLDLVGIDPVSLTICIHPRIGSGFADLAGQPLQGPKPRDSGLAERWAAFRVRLERP